MTRSCSGLSVARCRQLQAAIAAPLPEPARPQPDGSRRPPAKHLRLPSDHQRAATYPSRYKRAPGVFRRSRGRRRFARACVREGAGSSGPRLSRSWPLRARARRRSAVAGDCAGRRCRGGSGRWRARPADNRSSTASAIRLLLTAVSSEGPGPTRSRSITIEVADVRVHLEVGTGVAYTWPRWSRACGDDADRCRRASGCTWRPSLLISAAVMMAWSPSYATRSVSIPFGGHPICLSRTSSRSSAKILVYQDRNGFVLYYWLDCRKASFVCRRSGRARRMCRWTTTLAMLLDGIDVRYVQRPATWAPPAPIAPPG